MVESAEDKNSVAERLDEDRQRLAIEAGRWKDYVIFPVK